MPCMISSWSVADGVSLAISKSKLVYSSLIFVDINLPITYSDSFFHNTLVILPGEFCIVEDKSVGLMRMGHMTRATILPVTSPNVHRL